MELFDEKKPEVENLVTLSLQRIKKSGAKNLVDAVC
jgi:hypothetical protein